VERLAEEALPVGALYGLEAVAPEGAVTLERLRGRAAFSLLASRGGLGLPPLSRSRHLERWTEFVSRVPLYRLQVPRDLSRLGEVYRKILENLPSNR
jgi:hypothetical protein